MPSPTYPSARHRLWLPLLFAVLTTAIAGWYLWRSPVTYVATARLTTSNQVAEHHQHSDDANQVHLRTQVEVIQSPRLADLCIMRLRALQPTIISTPIRLDCSPHKNANIIDITVYGSEPEYVQHYVNAIMDEYLAWQKSLSEPLGSRMSLAVQETLIRERQVKELHQQGSEFTRHHPSVDSLKQESLRIAQQITDLKKVAIIDNSESPQQSAHLESQLNQIKETLLQSEALRQQTQLAEEGYALWSKKSQQEKLIEDSYRKHAVGLILQRATNAVAQGKPYPLYLSIAALAGLFIAYAISLLVQRRRIIPTA